MWCRTRVGRLARKDSAMKYGFIGIGKMGGAILKGLLDSGKINGSDVFICGRDFEKTKAQAEEFGVTAVPTHQEITDISDMIIVGVEPKTFPEVMPKIAESYTSGKIVVSMAAGVTIESIESYLGPDAKVIRIMPNAPARVGEMMASVSANKNVSADEVEMFADLLSGMGRAEIVPEDLISAVIGVSGSSPAYTYMYIKALKEAAAEYGMEKDAALTFAAQAVLGSAKIVLEECCGENAKTDIDTLIDNVCTPGGTTIEAVKTLRENGFEDLVKKGASAAIEKSISMSRK